MPSISVVIPTFNLQYEIQETLESVFNQTVAASEVIVVDDGSTDATTEIAKKFPIQLIEQENQGPGAARNAGVHAAKSDWIAFLDGDDLWLPNRIEALSEAIAQQKAATIIAANEYEGLRQGPWNYKELHRYFDPEKPSFEQLYRSCFLSTSSVAVRRSTFIELGGFDTNLQSAQDYDLWLRLAQKGPILFIPKPLSRYILRPNSISSRPFRRLKCLLKIADKHRGTVGTRMYMERVLKTFYEALLMSYQQRQWFIFLKIVLAAPGGVLIRLAPILTNSR